MKKVLNKRLTSLAVAAVMTVGAAGIAGSLKTSANAFADTGISQYAVLASSGTIGGVGIGYATTVNVNSQEPATLSLENVAAGQYIITARVTNEVDEWWIDLMAQVTGAEYPAYLSYDDTTGLYTALVTVSAGSKIELSTYAGSTLNVEVYLENLYLSANNSYSLYGVELPAKINLNNVIGDYIVNVQIDYNEEAGTPTIWAQVGDNARVELTPGLYNYTGTITITEDSKTLTLTTNSNVDISVSIYLTEVKTVNTPLPMSENTAATFAIYESQDFYYVAEGTGYYSITPNSTTADADFAIVLKNDPNETDGTYIEEGYPMYLVEGTRYYFNITYIGDSTGNSKSTAWFTVSDWKASTLKVNQPMVYAPITAENNAIKPIDLEAANGTYMLSLYNLPLDVLNGDYTITAHYINGTGEDVVKKDVNLELGSTEITIENATSIWFTTDYIGNLVAGVALNTLQQTGTLVVGGEPKSITLNGEESAIYTVTIPATGYYEVVLNLDGEPVQVEASTAARAIIPYGNTSGAFYAEVAKGETSSTVDLFFTHEGTGLATFSVIVRALSNAVIKLNEATNITVPAGTEKTYFVENLAEGIYSVEIPAGLKVEVYTSVTEDPVIVSGGTIGTFDVYYAQTVSLIFKNTGSADATFDVTVKKEANGYMYLGWENTISMAAGESSVTYYLDSLSEGTYTMDLNLPEGVEIQVTSSMSEEILIAYGNTSATFEITKDGTNVAFTFTKNVATAVEFGATVSLTANAKIKLGTPKTITLGAFETKTYDIEGLEAGDYVITLNSSTGLQIQVSIGDTIAIHSGYTSGMFSVDSNGTTVTLTFFSLSFTDVTFEVVVNMDL